MILFASSHMFATTTETINPGAYIINMGSDNQTIANGLKPYGLVYQLIVTQNVPVSWAIKESKTKDGEDFVADGFSYKGSAFIILAENVDPDVEALISEWRLKGVDVNGPSVIQFDAPIYKELTSWPRAILDAQNGDKVAAYYGNAEIPTSSYSTAGNPTMLTSCGDVYVLPHADPQNWQTSWKTALVNFVTEDKGYLWAACHAVSALEKLVPNADFLSEEGLIKWNQHNNGTPPYTYNPLYNSDPIMQFMGELDNATTNGSEQIYMPASDKNWRNSTKLAVYQPNHPNTDAGNAAVIAYGYAYGNTDYGMVMYEGGHDHNGGGIPIEAKVAAQRAYFNFLLLAGVQKEITATTTVPTIVTSGSDILVSAEGSLGNAPYTYEWSSSCEGGSFSDPTLTTTTFTAPIVQTTTTCVITVTVTDDCDRFSVVSTSITISPLAGPDAIDDNATTPLNIPIDIIVLSNDTEGDGDLDPTSVEFISGTEPDPNSEGIFTVNETTGLVTFTPVNGFDGDVMVDYQVCDENGLCDIATITVEITPLVGPTANDDNAATQINTPVDINVLSNDTEGDADLDPASVEFISGTEPDPNSVGTFTVNETTGLVTFTPFEVFVGNDVTVNYQVCDENGLCAVATITVDVVTGTNNLYPALGFGTLAYEDLWPAKGDYDFNDMVVDYQFEIFTNTSNYVETVIGTFTMRASGASLENGFGFQLSEDIEPDHVTVSGSELHESFITLNANGTEAGQSAPVIIVFDNIYKIMTHPGGSIGINTEENGIYVDPVTITITMEFEPNTYTYNDLDISSFNPFIFVNKDRTVEVHLPDYAPTDLVGEELFGTLDDDSNLGANRYYKTINNLPWAIHIYESFDYPIEKQQIVWAYHNFAGWAESEGESFQEWYKDVQGNRDDSKIYSPPTK